MSEKEGKRYGLIIKKRPRTIPSKLSIFGNDSSSDEEEKGRKNVKNTIIKEAEKKKQVRQTQIEMGKVLEDDPTAYDYDKVYDVMTEKKASLVAAKKNTTEKKSKYIDNLLKFAEVRKKEDERRVERQVQNEREAEGNEFADKDAFVTSAYRNKMQEMAEDEERQRRLDELEGDVTKQADLSMFYRNLLDNSVSTVAACEDQSTIDESHRAADVESTSSQKDKNERNKSSEKVERSKKDERRKDVDENEDKRRKRKRECESHEKGGRHRKISDKSERHRDKDEQQRRKASSPEVYTRREKKVRNDGEDTAARESGRDKHAVTTSKDEARQDHKKYENDETIGDKVNTTGDYEGINEGKNDIRKNNSDNDIAKLDVRMPDNDKSDKFVKHSSTETVLSARERYLARKKARVVVQANSENEDE